MGRLGLLVVALLCGAVLWASPALADHTGDLDCGDFASQRDAQDHLRAHPGDPDGLDGNDDDGVACESRPDPRDDTPIASEVGNAGTTATTSGGTATTQPLVSGSRTAPRVRIDGREYAAQCGANSLAVAGDGTQGGSLTVIHTFTINCAALPSSGGLPRTGQMILQWTGISLVLIALGFMLWAGDRYIGGRRRALHARR